MYNRIMTNTKSRVLKHRTHIFAGQEQSVLLIGWLNSKPKDPGRKRVMEILRIHRVARERIAATKSNDLMVTLPASYAQAQQIDKLLSRYRFRPQLLPTPLGAHFQWAPVKGERDFSGEETGLHIMRLAESRLLDKVRECRKCGRWFLRKIPEP